MKAIKIYETGGIDKLIYEDQPVPVASADEIVVQNYSIGINFFDIYQRLGVYSKSLPFIPGQEGSGVITAKGSAVTQFAIGDRVAYPFSTSGSYAEYTAVASNYAIKLPTELDFEMAAACLLQGLTADYLVYSVFPLQRHHTLLVHAGAGGVGLSVIQLAKFIGATVIATVSTAEKKSLAESVGADHVIIYTQENTATAVQHITQGSGVDVVYDSVGKTTFYDSLKCLRPRGMLVSFGQASGVIPAIAIADLQSYRSLFLTRPSLGDYIADRAEFELRCQRLFKHIASQQLKIHIGAKYPLANVKQAHQALEQRSTTGKLLLTV